MGLIAGLFGCSVRYIVFWFEGGDSDGSGKGLRGGGGELVMYVSFRLGVGKCWPIVGLVVDLAVMAQWDWGWVWWDQ